MNASKPSKHMIELISIALIGVLAGVLTGLVPEIRPNTIIFASMPVYIGIDIEFMIYASFISVLSVSHLPRFSASNLHAGT